MSPIGTDDFWEDLLDFIEQGKVIPIIGERAVTFGDADEPFYPWLAQELAGPVGRQRGAAGGHSHPQRRSSGTLSGADLQEIEAQLRPHQHEGSDFARLLDWRLLPPEKQPVDPYGTTTRRQAAARIIRTQHERA